MHRFFIPPEWIAGEKIELHGNTARQIVNVLRLKAGEHIILLDNSGAEYEVVLERLSAAPVEGRVVKKSAGAAEPVVRLTLYQALLKADNFEVVLQKGVELGVSEFAPYISARCVAKAPSGSRLARWQAVIREAAEQSDRVVLPVLKPVVTFEEACESVPKPALIFWEEEKNLPLREALGSGDYPNSEIMSLFIGPEGGFPAAEVALAESRGILPVSLGKRTLRAETAAVAAISAVMYARGELG